MEESFTQFDLGWDGAPVAQAAPLFPAGDGSVDDWEARYNEDTTGYVPDPLTTSFTDLDLRPALLAAGVTEEWSTEAWPEADDWE
ncbi:MAG TPA: hypothetical protein VGI56_11550 [Galbitalea sp.]|jgi:hypothetical protein